MRAIWGRAANVSPGGDLGRNVSDYSIYIEGNTFHEQTGEWLCMNDFNVSRMPNSTLAWACRTGPGENAHGKRMPTRVRGMTPVMKQGDVSRKCFELFHRLTAADSTQVVRLQFIAG